MSFKRRRLHSTVLKMHKIKFDLSEFKKNLNNA
jgi:hypothetical protein